MLEEKKIPTEREIETWLKNQINKIKLSKNVNATDGSLSTIIKRFCYVRAVKDDGYLNNFSILSFRHEASKLNVIFTFKK